MPLSSDELGKLYAVAKEHWLSAEATLYAYDRAFRSSKRTSEWFKRGTVGAAVLTAVSTVQPLQLQWLTAAAGVITAIIAAMDQIYAPAANTQDFWDRRNQFEALKRDLVNCAITIDQTKDLFKGAEPFAQLGSRIAAIATVPVDIIYDDRNQASTAFHNTVIASMIERLSGAPAADDDEEPALPEDAPDIVSAYRPLAR